MNNLHLVMSIDKSSCDHRVTVRKQVHCMQQLVMTLYVNVASYAALLEVSDPSCNQDTAAASQ